MNLRIKNQFKKCIKGILSFLLLFFSFYASSQSFTKKIEKAFLINDHTIIKLDNRYGKVIIVPTLKKQVYIEVMQKGITETNINSLFTYKEDKTTNELSIYINLESHLTKEDRSNTIYRIEIPLTNTLNIITKYGVVDLENFQGDLDIQSNYSKINIDSILSNKINLLSQYSKINIDYIKKATLENRYSTIYIAKSDSLFVSNIFSQLNINKIKYLSINSKHGKININQANTIYGNSSFSKVQINYLESTIKMNTNYAPVFRIDKLGNDFSVEVNSTFQPVHIKLNTQSTHIHIETTFGELIYKSSNFSFQEQIINTTSHIYKGFYQTEKTKSKILVFTKYGNVIFD